MAQRHTWPRRIAPGFISRFLRCGVRIIVGRLRRGSELDLRAVTKLPNNTDAPISWVSDGLVTINDRSYRKRRGEASSTEASGPCRGTFDKAVSSGPLAFEADAADMVLIAVLVRYCLTKGLQVPKMMSVALEMIVHRSLVSGKTYCHSVNPTDETREASAAPVAYLKRAWLRQRALREYCRELGQLPLADCSCEVGFGPPMRAGPEWRLSRPLDDGVVFDENDWSKSQPVRLFRFAPDGLARQAWPHCGIHKTLHGPTVLPSPQDDSDETRIIRLMRWSWSRAFLPFIFAVGKAPHCDNMAFTVVFVGQDPQVTTSESYLG
jgi:hypothetical protein